MTPKNKLHLKKVLAWGGGLSAALALLSLLKYPPVVALGIMTGAALGLFNLYSIVMVVEALAGAAASGPGAGKASKVFSTITHVVKLALILAVLLLLVVFKLTDLFGLLAGLTVVLLVNLATGLLMVKEDADKAA